MGDIKRAVFRLPETARLAGENINSGLCGGKRKMGWGIFRFGMSRVAVVGWVSGSLCQHCCPVVQQEKMELPTSFYSFVTIPPPAVLFLPYSGGLLGCGTVFYTQE
ncbi:hypothetical protein [Paralysiella testudinis]|uniref:Uncharacterized protein n=1 Tax=Paralysiella testudinis TaxID=2809020 RepID=A0A892ZIP4_9NEIS|nr:hypothetical protein [Paralysiella testudinis]QRQ82802.1 hypothetical protein JQU52_05305 [Paralysiella testudinis]